VYREQGDILQAVDTYEKAILLATQQGLPYSYLPFNLGLLYQTVNRLDDAERFYRQAIDTAESSRPPRDDSRKPEFRERAVALNALATVEMARKRYRNALVFVNRALEDAPSLAQAMHNKALLLILMSSNGLSSEAESLWRRAIEVDPPAVVERVALPLS
jgi:tetratricopeptide (TPR) repeat protein